MSDSTGRPYYLLALVAALLLLAWGGVAVVGAFGRLTARGSEVAVEAASPARAGGGAAPRARTDALPGRDTRTALEILDPLEGAFHEAVAAVQAGDRGPAVSIFEQRCAEAGERLGTAASVEQAAGHWSAADGVRAADAVAAYRLSALRLRDFAGSGQTTWLDQATVLAARAHQDAEALHGR